MGEWCFAGTSETAEGNDDGIGVIVDVLDNEAIEQNIPLEEQQAPEYVADCIGQQILQKIDCEVCRECVTASELGPEHAFIRMQEYSEDRLSLTYPSKNLSMAVTQATSIFQNHIAPKLHIPNLLTTANLQMSMGTDFSWLRCAQHGGEITMKFLDTLVPFLIRTECKRRNEVLREKTQQIKLAREARRAAREARQTLPQS